MEFLFFAQGDFTWRDGFNYGVPTGILLGLAFVLWRFSMWARDKVVDPMLKSHLDLVGELKSCLPKIVDEGKRQTSFVEAQTDELKKQSGILTNINKAVDAAAEKTAETLKKQEEHTRWSQNIVSGICRLKEPPK